MSLHACKMSLHACKISLHGCKASLQVWSGAKNPHFEAKIVKKRPFRACSEANSPVWMRKRGFLRKTAGFH